MRGKTRGRLAREREKRVGVRQMDLELRNIFIAAIYFPLNLH